MFIPNCEKYGPEIENIDSPYIVDDSAFIPQSEAVKQVNALKALSDVEIKSMYDFPDGRDDGRKSSFIKYHKDIAEVSQDIRAQTSKVKQSLKDYKDEVERRKKFKERLEKN